MTPLPDIRVPIFNGHDEGQLFQSNFAEKSEIDTFK